LKHPRLYYPTIRLFNVAYCPRCDKVVEDKWLECPVCRSELVQRDELLRREEARRFASAPSRAMPQSPAQPMPQRRDEPVRRPDFRRQPRPDYPSGRTDFFGRVTGVLSFKVDVLKGISKTRPYNEIIFMYLLNLIFSISFQSAQSAKSFSEIMPQAPATSESLVVFTLISSGIGLVISLIGVGIAHFVIKMFNGRGGFSTTLATMFYVSMVWTVVLNIIGIVPLALSPSLMIIFSLSSILIAIVVLVEYVIALAAAHELDKMKSAIAVAISWGVQFTIYMALTIAVIGFLAIILMGGKGALPAH